MYTHVLFAWWWWLIWVVGGDDELLWGCLVVIIIMMLDDHGISVWFLMIMDDYGEEGDEKRDLIMPVWHEEANSHGGFAAHFRQIEVNIFHLYVGNSCIGYIILLSCSFARFCHPQWPKQAIVMNLCTRHSCRKLETPEVEWPTLTNRLQSQDELSGQDFPNGRKSHDMTLETTDNLWLSPDFWSSDDPSPWGLNCSPMQRPRAYDRALSLPVRPSEIAGAGRNRMIPLGEAHQLMVFFLGQNWMIWIYIYMVTLCKMDRTSVLWRGNTGFRNRFSLIYYPLVI